MKPEKADYGDPVNGLWVCHGTTWCSNLSPDQVRNGGLAWTGRAFICPICKGVMSYTRGGI